ncbi:MAG TPA: hypothetical protein PKZ53_25955, partial [Acidobacteriota bacterium]|nr:hypothetical protein [Acidobacteriota bacterium]
VTIDLLDENNQLIASNEVTTNNCQFCAIAYGSPDSYYLVAPFFDISGPRLRSVAFYFLRERAFQVKVSTEDLPRVKSVKLEFKPAAG